MNYRFKADVFYHDDVKKRRHGQLEKSNSQLCTMSQSKPRISKNFKNSGEFDDGWHKKAKFSNFKDQPNHLIWSVGS